MTKTFQIGSKTFTLDQDKAEAAYAAKKVILGRETMTFNLLPLKYQWAYELYRTMKANHWEPEDVPMGKDIEQWKDKDLLSDVERWIIMMGVGYFSAAEGIVGDNILHVIRELVTAPELKLVLGRHAHEENIHADSLLYMVSSLGINPHECENQAARCATRHSGNRHRPEATRCRSRPRKAWLHSREPCRRPVRVLPASSKLHAGPRRLPFVAQVIH
jgi:ribonucleotide reductase beta subunit family protein with ferritin-like domain